MITWEELKLGTGSIRVRRDTWRTTTLRLIRAEQQLEAKEFFSMSEKDDAFEAGRQHGQEQVFRLIARWGKCRPLEGMGGADMAEALRKVLTPTVVPYADYKGITQAVTDGGVKLTDIPICDAKSGEWVQYRFRPKK